MMLPDFFIVGAPKCGTTAISEYLRTHPRIFMCKPKEPHYFALDIPGYRLHPLTGNLKGLWSIRVTGNWRIVFSFENGEASDIDLIDYH